MRLTVLASIATFATVSAHAADRNVDLINKTGMTMTAFYASVTNTNSWEENILGNDNLANGDTQTVDINDGSGQCVFDFKANFKDGSTAEKRGVNVCQISTFTFTR